MYFESSNYVQSAWLYIDAGWMGVKCKLVMQQCFIIPFRPLYWQLFTIARIKWKKSFSSARWQAILKFNDTYCVW